jgi:hypothetical protein
MRFLPSVLAVLASICLSCTNVFAASDQVPPTARIVTEDFSPMTETWQPVSGRWTVGSGTYGSSFAGATDISTVTQYRQLDPTFPSTPKLQSPDFFVRARVRNDGFDDTHHVGIVYGYQDAQNYYEVILSAVGSVRVRTVVNGVVSEDSPSAALTGCTRTVWCELEVHWAGGVASLKINGQQSFPHMSQPEFTSGRVGFVTHSAVGRFDKLLVGEPFGDQPFLETFDGAAPSVTFTPKSGQWSVSNGSYRNSAIQQTSVTLAPIFTGLMPNVGNTTEYTFRARMLNGYAGSGNLVGIVFNYLNSSYSEVVFSPTGIAKLNLVENGVVVRTLATANYGGTRNVGFDVELQNDGNGASVLVNGKLLFDSIAEANPEQFVDGGVGLITHWAPGRFDNVEFDHGTFQPCALTFSQPITPSWIVSGTWDTNGGTLNSTAVTQNDIANLHCFGNSTLYDAATAGTDEIYSARLRNEFGASGNLVGLVYNYQDARTGSFYDGDYFEITFSPTGVVQLNKFIQGVRYPVRSRTHTIPRNTWFDVQVIRSGIFTTVKLNGTTILENEPQGELHGGSIGAITHWTKGHFDDATLVPFVVRPASQL